jgi:hypothetical protein
MIDHAGSLWRTTEHHTHVEYQSLIKDLMLESEYLGRSMVGGEGHRGPDRTSSWRSLLRERPNYLGDDQDKRVAVPCS